ncbi:hypothetical protein OG195_21710 [Streptomyces sp. NBC_01362]|nr:hypothetical protein [Streptomyces sp. NBC_01362]
MAIGGTVFDSCDSQRLLLFHNTGYAGSYTRFSSSVMTREQVVSP